VPAFLIGAAAFSVGFLLLVNECGRPDNSWLQNIFCGQSLKTSFRAGLVMGAVLGIANAISTGARVKIPIHHSSDNIRKHFVNYY
jgi:hypothetical protein